MRVYLTGVSDDEYNDTEGQRLSAAHGVGGVGAGQSTNQATDAHEGDDDTLDDTFELPVVGGPSLAKTALEVGEDEHTGNLTRVVAEEETTQTGYSAQEDGLDTAVGAIDPDGPDFSTR